MRLIDADALSKVLDNIDERYGIDSCGEGIHLCMIAVAKAPTIIDCGEIDHETLGKIPYMDLRPKKWIPCSERMPEHGEQVLLWVKEKGDRPLSIKPDYHVGRLEHMNGDPDGKSNFWGIPVKPCEWRMQGWSYFFEPDVLAWMPLPEPYKEGDSDAQH